MSTVAERLSSITVRLEAAYGTPPVVVPPVDTSIPTPSGTVLVDLRGAIQGTTTDFATAMAASKAVYEVAQGRPFSLDLDIDGAGTHGLRVDYPAWNGVTAQDDGATLILYLPKVNGAYPKHVLFSWKHKMFSPFQITNPAASYNASRKMWLTLRDRPDLGGEGRVDYIWPGPAPISPRVDYATQEKNYNVLPGVSFNPQEHVGEVLRSTLEYKAESTAGAADGVVRLWINGQKLIEYTAASIGAEAFQRFQFPCTFNSPAIAQSEVFWDVVCWTPEVASPPVIIVPPSKLDGVDFDPTTGAGVGGSTGTPISFDAALWYPSDVEFRKNIRFYGNVPGNPLVSTHDVSKSGTGGPESLYTDGNNPDLITWQDQVTYLGTPMWEYLHPGDNEGSSDPGGQMSIGLSTPIHSAWMWERRMYQKGWTPFGDGTSDAAKAFNATQAAGWKCGPYVGYGYRDSKGFNGGQTIYGRAGLQSVQDDYDANVIGDDLYLCSISQAAGDRYNDGGVYDNLVRINQYIVNGSILSDLDVYSRKCGSGSSFVRLGEKKTVVVGDASKRDMIPFNGWQYNNKNYNQSRSTQQRYWSWGGWLWDADVDVNPFNVQL